MNSYTHMMVGSLAGGLFIAKAASERAITLEVGGSYTLLPVVITLAAAIGGVAPDIDMPRSKSGRFFRVLMKSALVASAAMLLLMLLNFSTGIEFLDRAISFGTNIDKIYPITLAAICATLLIIVEKANHRGLTHTGVVMLLIAAPMLYFFKSGVNFGGVNIVLSAQIGFAVGWLSHLIIDTFNYPGVPWLWPVINNHFNVARVDSGTSEEKGFRDVCVVIFAASYAMILFGVV